MTTDSKPVVVTRLRDTIPLNSGRFRQIFDAVNFPGLRIACTTERDGSTVRQIYELDDGRRFDDVDAALDAWRSPAESEVIDRFGEALRRLARGLVRPLWQDMTVEQKASYLRTAAVLVRLMAGFGLRVVKEKQNGG